MNEGRRQWGRVLDCSTAPSDISEEELSVLRKATLLAERETTRKRARRKLERIADQKHPFLSPLAQASLASSFFWSGDLLEAATWAKRTIQRYPMTAAAVWCSTLVVLAFRSLGMRRERFEAESERLRVMQVVAFRSENVMDRIYALQELMRELEARDLRADAEKCADELRDLIKHENVALEQANY